MRWSALLVIRRYPRLFKHCPNIVQEICRSAFCKGVSWRSLLLAMSSVLMFSRYGFLPRLIQRILSKYIVCILTPVWLAKQICIFRFSRRVHLVRFNCRSDSTLIVMTSDLFIVLTFLASHYYSACLLCLYHYLPCLSKKAHSLSQRAGVRFALLLLITLAYKAWPVLS